MGGQGFAGGFATETFFNLPPFVILFGRDFFNETADFRLAAKMVQTTGLDL
jgi:hypothetical protein